MATFFYSLVPFAIGVVALILLLGLVNMMRGGSPNTSQKLMRLRVLFQFIALIVIMIAQPAELAATLEKFVSKLGAELFYPDT